MSSFTLSRSFRGATITAQITQLDSGVHVLLFGGDRSHVGAAAMAQEGTLLESAAFPGHREKAIAEEWAERLSARAGTAAVACGIHYDHITPEEIQGVLNICGELLEEALRCLSGERTVLGTSD